MSSLTCRCRSKGSQRAATPRQRLEKEKRRQSRLSDSPPLSWLLCRGSMPEEAYKETNDDFIALVRNKGEQKHIESPFTHRPQTKRQAQATIPDDGESAPKADCPPSQRAVLPLPSHHFTQEVFFSCQTSREALAAGRGSSTRKKARSSWPRQQTLLYRLTRHGLVAHWEYIWSFVISF